MNSSDIQGIGVSRLAGTRIPVTDMAASVAFYMDILGLQRSGYSDDAQDLFVGDAEISLVRASHPVLIGVSFYVHDLGVAVAVLRDRGIHVDIQGPIDVGNLCDYARYAMVHDPDGNIVTLLEVTAEWRT